MSIGQRQNLMVYRFEGAAVEHPCMQRIVRDACAGKRIVAENRRKNKHIFTAQERVHGPSQVCDTEVIHHMDQTQNVIGVQQYHFRVTACQKQALIYENTLGKKQSIFETPHCMYKHTRTQCASTRQQHVGI